MAKRRGKSRGKKVSFGPKGQIRLTKKPTKRQKFISKITRDGKVSKKEGRKAAKKGVSLRKIQNRNIGDYRRSVRDYERRPTERRGSRRPTYEPLKIKRGAERADFARQMRDYEQRGDGRTRGGRTRGGRGGGGGSRPDPGPTNQYQSEIEEILGGNLDQSSITSGAPDPNQGLLDTISALEDTIAGLSFEMPDYDAQFAAMKAEQENYLQELAARQAEAERQRELAFRTSQENTARGGLTPDFRIGARSPRDQMGTGGFIRRPRRRPAVVAQGITPTSSAGYNANPNTAQARGINLAAINRAPAGYSKI
jgi:hypothetical protein